MLPAAGVVLNQQRSTSILPILELLAEFPLPNQLLPLAMLPLVNLLVPSGNHPAALESFWALLHRPGVRNALRDYNMASLLRNKRCAKALTKKEVNRQALLGT